MPSKLLAALAKAYPEAWRDADKKREQRGKDMPGWDPAVFMPLAVWYELICRYKKASVPGPYHIMDMNRLAFAAAWRPGQDIIRFDPDVMTSLLATPLEGQIPADILWRLPAWCVYVDVPLSFADMEWRGFMAMLEEDASKGRELRLLFLAEDDDLEIPVHLGDWTVKEAVQRVLAQVAEGARKAGIAAPGTAALPDFAPGIAQAIPLLLYLCAYGFDDRERAPGSAVSYPAAKKVKKGWRIFPPDAPKVHMLGENFGRQIRQARACAHEGSHASKRPHIRRAHWHGFWTGKKEERKLSIRWLPPIAVAMKEDEDDE